MLLSEADRYTHMPQNMLIIVKGNGYNIVSYFVKTDMQGISVHVKT